MTVSYRLPLCVLLCFVFLTQIGCSNVIIRHRSRIQFAIHVYINWKRVCVIPPGKTCRIQMKRGRYTFYALVPGRPQFRWASANQPAPFVVDKRTVIVLRNNNKPKQLIIPLQKGTKPIAPAAPRTPPTP